MTVHNLYITQYGFALIYIIYYVFTIIMHYGVHITSSWHVHNAHNRFCLCIIQYVKYIMSEIIPGLWTLWTDYGHYKLPGPLMSCSFDLCYGSRVGTEFMPNWHQGCQWWRWWRVRLRRQTVRVYSPSQHKLEMSSNACEWDDDYEDNTLSQQSSRGPPTLASSSADNDKEQLARYEFIR